MLSKDQIKSILVFDLEACAQYSSYEELLKNNPRHAEIFERRTWPKLKEENETLEETYNKAVLLGEYNKILCGSFAMIKFEAGIPTLSVVNISDHDEVVVLNKIAKLINDFTSAFDNSKLCGFNIKGWDIPVLAKRMIINKVKLPSILDISDKKPWEIQHHDLSDTWSFGTRRAVPLELILSSLDIETSKDDISGDEVQKTYYSMDKSDKALRRITDYCAKDTIATARVLLRLNQIEDVDVKNNVTIKDI